MTDPKNLFTLHGIVYDIGDSVVDGATVKIENTRNGDKQTYTTNELGEYTFEISNFDSAHAVGDIILIHGWKDGTPFKIRTTSVLIESGDDGKQVDLHLRPVLTNDRLIVPPAKADLKEIQRDTHSDEFGAKNTINVEAERSDFTRNSSGYATIIIEYIRGVKKTTTITRNSSNEVTKIEVS